MKESDLIKYFKNELSVNDLHKIVSKSIQKRGATTSLTIDEDLLSDYYLSKNDIIKLCDDYTREALNQDDLSFIGFTIIGSNEIDTKENDMGDRLLKVVGDWANYDILHPITKDNMRKWKDYLNTGKYEL